MDAAQRVVARQACIPLPQSERSLPPRDPGHDAQRLSVASCYNSAHPWYVQTSGSRFSGPKPQWANHPTMLGTSPSEGGTAEAGPIGRPKGKESASQAGQLAIARRIRLWQAGDLILQWEEAALKALQKPGGVQIRSTKAQEEFVTTLPKEWSTLSEG